MAKHNDPSNNLSNEQISAGAPGGAASPESPQLPGIGDRSGSFRPAKMASEIQTAVQKILTKGLSDPRLEGSMITITGVHVTQDLKTAHIGISVLPEKHENRVRAGLNHCARFIRREAGEITQARSLPEFDFRIDSSLKKQAAVMEALGKLARERDAEAAAGNPSKNPTAGPGASGETRTGG